MGKKLASRIGYRYAQIWTTPSTLVVPILSKTIQIPKELCSYLNNVKKGLPKYSLNAYQYGDYIQEIVT